MNLCPFVPRPHLILYKMLGLSSLVLATMLFSPPAARAGSWVFTCTGSGSATPDSNSSTPQAGGNHYRFGGCTSSASTGRGATAQADMSVTITLKGTWTHNVGQTDATDPAPPSVWLEETGSAFWSGVTHTSTPPTGSCTNPLKGGETEVASTNPIGGTRSGHQFTQVSVSGGVATLTRTFSGTASAPSAPANWSSATAGLGSYQVTVHPTPYNFKKVVGGGNIGFDGTLSFTYDWLSTDSNRSDLTTCYWREYVTYQGPVGTAANPNKYYPQNPPFNFIPEVSWLNNPFVNPAPPSLGNLMTGPTATDTQNVPPLVAPWSEPLA